MAQLDHDAGWKFRNRVVTDDQSVLAYVQWNPRRILAIDGAATVTAARMQVQASQVNFDINAVADTTIGTYTGNTGGDDAVMFVDAATVQGLLDRINGLELGIDRYIADLGDFRPGFVIGTGDGIAVGLSNILLGWDGRSASFPSRSGLEVFADSSGLGVANTFSVGCGTGGTKRGGGQFFPDNRQVEYTSTVAGVTTLVRAPLRTQEKVYTAATGVKIVSIHFGAVYATNAKVITIFDRFDNQVYQRSIAAATDLADAARYSFDNPIVEGVGPFYVQAVGTGALTDGPLNVGWYERVG
jgi:hypothetical protein